MMKCRICKGDSYVSEILQVCVDCIRNKSESSYYVENAHYKIREKFNLPINPPKSQGGIPCGLCSNECQLINKEVGYCGVRQNLNGRLIPNGEYGILYKYLDPLPTNCCASWFCSGSREIGKFNLAVFFYGCNFNCIFCQNSSHKNISYRFRINSNEFIDYVLKNERISCICYFGGSPEPHLPFAINVSEKIIRERSDIRICWEWNGCGNENLVRRAAEISLLSGGNVKFDLKAFTPELSIALSGVSNERAYENFEMIVNEFYHKREEPVITATTLLVPGYVDSIEIEKIAKFISDLNSEIPYSLLVFHPSFYMSDLPITPRRQVEECYNTAKKYLKNVNIGNKHLLNL